VRNDIDSIHFETPVAPTLVRSNAFVSDADHETACALFRYWQALPTDKPRQAVDPVTVGARLIAHLNLLSRTTANDFRYDLVGSVLQTMAPRLKPGALAGAIVDIDPTRTFIFDRLTACADSATARGFQARFASVDSKPVAALAFIFPLDITEGRANSLLLGVWASRTDEPLPWQARRSDIIDDVAGFLFEA
jgi:hypothetical protein